MTLAVLSGAAAGILLALYLVHAMLRLFMPDRGVPQWGIRDTVGATPLLLLGAGLVGSAIAVGAVSIARSAAGVWTMVTVALLMAAVGFLLIWFGVNALRKLT